MPEDSGGRKVRTTGKVSLEEIRKDLCNMVATELDTSVNAIDVSTGFYDLGLDSGMLLKLVTALEEKTGEKLYPTLLSSAMACFNDEAT